MRVRAQPTSSPRARKRSPASSRRAERLRVAPQEAQGVAPGHHPQGHQLRAGGDLPAQGDRLGHPHGGVGIDRPQALGLGLEGGGEGVRGVLPQGALQQGAPDGVVFQVAQAPQEVVQRLRLPGRRLRRWPPSPHVVQPCLALTRPRRAAAGACPPKIPDSYRPDKHPHLGPATVRIVAPGSGARRESGQEVPPGALRAPGEGPGRDGGLGDDRRLLQGHRGRRLDRRCGAEDSPARPDL